MTKEDYAKRAYQWAKALKLLDPSITLILCGVRRSHLYEVHVKHILTRTPVPGDWHLFMGLLCPQPVRQVGRSRPIWRCDQVTH
jgi:hypothetical protein